MHSFDEIFEIAAKRKGGRDVLESFLEPPASEKELEQIPPDRWLAMMARCIFNSGFNWKVVDAKWSGFEEAFDGFDPGKVSFYTDDDLGRLVSDTRIIRHGAKIRSVQENAGFIIELHKEFGSVGKALGGWPSEEFIDLLAMLKKRGSRLGGNTGQYFLRFINRDGFILSADVVGRLIAEGVVEKTPTSQKSMRAVQDAFNEWSQQSGRSLKEISRVLAMSVG